MVRVQPHDALVCVKPLSNIKSAFSREVECETIVWLQVACFVNNVFYSTVYKSLRTGLGCKWSLIKWNLCMYQPFGEIDGSAMFEKVGLVLIVSHKVGIVLWWDNFSLRHTVKFLQTGIYWHQSCTLVLPRCHWLVVDQLFKPASILQQ